MPLTNLKRLNAASRRFGRRKTPNITDPMGASANVMMTKSASRYHSHGNLFMSIAVHDSDSKS